MPKIKVKYSGSSAFALRRRILEVLGTHALDVVSDARYYLGVPIGPGAQSSYWDCRFGQVCTPLRCSSCVAIALEFPRCAVRGVLLVGAVVPRLSRPDARLARIEAATIRSLCAAPMYVVTPAALASLKQLGSPLGFRTISDSCRAASMRLALRSDVLDTIRDDIARAGDLDVALLLPRAAEWLSACPLAFSLALRISAHRLPREIVDHPHPEALIRRQFAADEAPSGLRAWVRRRLSPRLERAATDGEIELVVARMWARIPRVAFFLAFASARLLGNAWCTTRRMTCERAGCQFGCWMTFGITSRARGLPLLPSSVGDARPLGLAPR